MRGPRPVPCIFPDAFLQAAMDTVRRRTASVQDVQRFRLVLLLNQQPTISHDEAGRIVGLSARQVQRWRRRWAAGDFDVDDLPGRGRKPVFSPCRRSRHRRHGLRSRRGNRSAAQPAIDRRLDQSSKQNAGQADQQQHGVADVARACHQALAVRALDFSA